MTRTCDAQSWRSSPPPLTAQLGSTRLVRGHHGMADSALCRAFPEERSLRSLLKGVWLGLDVRVAAARRECGSVCYGSGVVCYCCWRGWED